MVKIHPTEHCSLLMNSIEYAHPELMRVSYRQFPHVIKEVEITVPRFARNYSFFFFSFFSSRVYDTPACDKYLVYNQIHQYQLICTCCTSYTKNTTLCPVSS